MTEKMTEKMTEIASLKEELDFYKSIFDTHRGSAIYNLSIKHKNGQRVWIDRILCDKRELLYLDQDEEVIEWLKPVKCER